jgi:hypothetical protein
VQEGRSLAVQKTTWSRKVMTLVMYIKGFLHHKLMQFVVLQGGLLSAVLVYVVEAHFRRRFVRKLQRT